MVESQEQRLWGETRGTPTPAVLSVNYQNRMHITFSPEYFSYLQAE